METSILGNEGLVSNPMELQTIDSFTKDMDQVLENFVRTKLSDRYWRLDNLYTIIDKEDNKVIMRLNHAQNQHYIIKHQKTITLKSRQQGISTYKVAEGLDKCIYNSNTQAGIQSYGLNESQKLFKKAMLMWDEYDEDILGLLGIKIVSASATSGIVFSNGSSLRIGNFRGDTLSNLHVSELAKIAKKFPEKAEELNTGAFEAVGLNSNISIESTAEGASGLFFDIWVKAEERLKSVGMEGLTPLDFYPIFLSWMDDPDCSMEQYYEAMEEDKEYFKKVEKYQNKPLTQGQKNWCAAKRSRLQSNFDREYPYSPKSAFEMTVEGTYYQKQYELLYNQKRVKTVGYIPGYPVYAIFDLGMNDTMAINFAQVINGTPRIIGEYENSGENIEFYVNIMQALPYNIDMVYLPHDANVRDLSTGRTRVEEFRRLGCSCIVLERQSIQDGINAARLYLQEVEISNECTNTLLAIQNYRQHFDEKLKVYTGRPIHDKFSHFADVVRYSALALSHYKVKQSVPVSNRQRYETSKSMTRIAL